MTNRCAPFASGGASSSLANGHLVHGPTPLLGLPLLAATVSPHVTEQGREKDLPTNSTPSDPQEGLHHAVCQWHKPTLHFVCSTRCQRACPPTAPLWRSVQSRNQLPQTLIASHSSNPITAERSSGQSLCQILCRRHLGLITTSLQLARTLHQVQTPPPASTKPGIVVAKTC